MSYDIEDILEVQRCMEIEGVPPNMVYRKEKSNKITRNFTMAVLELILNLVVMGYIANLCINVSTYYLIAFIPPFIAFIILSMHLKYFFHDFLNQNYKIIVKDNQLHFDNAFLEGSCDLPMPIIFEGEEIKFSILNDLYNLKLHSDTVNGSGKSLVDFLLEANCSF